MSKHPRKAAESLSFVAAMGNVDHDSADSPQTAARFPYATLAVRPFTYTSRPLAGSRT